jgi:hypothetical protein
MPNLKRNYNDPRTGCIYAQQPPPQPVISNVETPEVIVNNSNPKFKVITNVENYTPLSYRYYVSFLTRLNKTLLRNSFTTFDSEKSQKIITETIIELSSNYSKIYTYNNSNLKTVFVNFPDLTVTHNVTTVPYNPMIKILEKQISIGKLIKRISEN